jgi:hypothetical protein
MDAIEVANALASLMCWEVWMSSRWQMPYHQVCAGKYGCHRGGKCLSITYVLGSCMDVIKVANAFLTRYV